MRASKDNSFRASRSVLLFELRLRVLYWIKTVSSFELIDMGWRPGRKKNILNSNILKFSWFFLENIKYLDFLVEPLLEGYDIKRHKWLFGV